MTIWEQMKRSSRGIGFAPAVGLAGMGATVLINGRTRESTDAAMAKAKAAAPKGRLEPVPGDLAAREGANAVIAASRELDVLVNNMSIYDVKALQDITDAD